MSPGGQQGQQQEPGLLCAASSHHIMVEPGQSEAAESRWKSEDLGPLPSCSHHPPRRAASRSLSTPFAQRKVPALGQQIRYQSPGPSSFKAAGIVMARAAMTSHETPHPQCGWMRAPAHTHACTHMRTYTRMSPDWRDCSQNLVKELPQLKTNRTKNYNPRCSEQLQGRRQGW